MNLKNLLLATLLLSCSFDLLRSEEQTTIRQESDRSTALFYLDRGESYLASGQFDEAIRSLHKGYDINFSEDTESFREELHLRFLFAMMLGYACTDEEAIALKISDYLQNLLDNWECKDCVEIYKCKDEEYVIGPDKQPYDGWCREVVTTTAAALKGVVRGSKLPLAAKESIIFTIDKFQGQATICCNKGGLWKACVGPLAKKLHEWKMLGVPADPMWD